MADALMATRSMRRSDLVLRGAQSICIVSIAILTIACANGYNGVVLGGVLLFTCFGMGLSVSYGIVAAHGGLLRLADGSRGKTKLVVELPAARWQPEAGGAHTPESNGSLARVPAATSTSS